MYEHVVGGGETEADLRYINVTQGRNGLTNHLTVVVFRGLFISTTLILVQL